MKIVSSYLGWVVAVVATVCAVLFFMDGRALKDSMRGTNLQYAALRDEIGKTHAAVDELTARCATLEAAAAEKTAKATKPGGQDASGRTDSPSLFESAMSLLKDSSPAAGKKVDVAGLMKGLINAKGGDSAGGLAAMFEGPQGEQMMDMGAKFATNMQYDPFVNGLQIPSEQKQQVRDILTKYNSEMMRKSMGVLQGKSDFAAVAADTGALKEQMRAELKTALGTDGLAEFDAYQEEMPERMLNQLMDMQLGMFAGGLTAENRTMVRDVLVQELLPGQPDPSAPTSPDQLGTVSETQRAAFERALQRLQPTLPPDQYSEVEGFVRQQQDMMEMVTNMMPKPAAAATPAQ